MRKIYDFIVYSVEWEQIVNVVLLGFFLGLGFSTAVKIIL